MFRLKQSRMRSRIRSKKFHCQMDAMFVFLGLTLGSFIYSKTSTSLTCSQIIVYNACHVAYSMLSSQEFVRVDERRFRSLAVLPLLPPVWLHHHPEACTLGDLGAVTSKLVWPRPDLSQSMHVQGSSRPIDSAAAQHFGGHDASTVALLRWRCWLLTSNSLVVVISFRLESTHLHSIPLLLDLRSA